MRTPDLQKSLDAVPLEMLPDGTSIRPRYAREFRYWISDDPPVPGSWAQFAVLQPVSGLWPVFLHGDENEPDNPWVDGNVGLPRLRGPEEYDTDAVLEELWATHTEPD